VTELNNLLTIIGPSINQYKKFNPLLNQSNIFKPEKVKIMTIANFELSFNNKRLFLHCYQKTKDTAKWSLEPDYKKALTFD
jgi:hypothetical protein